MNSTVKPIAKALTEAILRLAAAAPRIAWRVYEAPEGGGQAYCGEFPTLTAAQAHAETEPEGLWDYQRATARASGAGHCDGLAAAPEAGIEDDEPVSWHGESGWHCVVRVVYPVA